MTTGTLTSSSDKLLNMISPEENSGVSNLSPSPSPPQSPSVQSSSLGSNKKLITPHKNHHNNLNNNILTSNGGGGSSSGAMASSINSNGISSASNNLNNNDIEMIEAHSSEYDGMSKSRSSDSQLSVNGGSHKQHNQQQLHHNGTDAVHNESIAPPRSPCTPVRGMGHMIQHRFSKKFKFTTSTCDLCNKQMFFGFKCTECKYRCHKDCKSSVPPSCGLPKEFVDEFKKIYLNSDGLGIPNASPSLSHRPSGLMPRKEQRRPPMHNSIPFHGADSSSAGSSCNSSSPSSPALLTIPPQTPANKSQFNFPEVSSSSSTSQSSSLHHHNNLNNNNINNYSSYPNTIIEDAEFEHPHGHSKLIEKNGTVFLRNNYHHSLTSPIITTDSQINIKHNGSITDSNGKK